MASILHGAICLMGLLGVCIACDSEKDQGRACVVFEPRKPHASRGSQGQKTELGEGWVSSG